MINKLFLTIVALIIIASLVFIGCAKTTPTPAPVPTPAPAQAPSVPPASTSPIRVGLLYPLTGYMAMTGTKFRDASLLAFGDAGYQIAGKKIEVVVADSGGNPSMAIDGARKMLEFDKVATIIGPIGGDETMAVGDYMSKAGVPHLNTSLANWKILSMPWSIAGAGSEQQFTSTAGRYAWEGMHFKTVTAITSDANFSRDFVIAFKAAFEAGGGKVIQEQYAPLPCTDFASYIVNLKPADAVAAWFQGSDAITFLSQVDQFGVRKTMPIYAAFFGAFMEEYILNAMPKEAADAVIGEITTTPYSPLIDSDVSKKFVADYKQKTGITPDNDITLPYDVVNILLSALMATGGDTTPEKLREAIIKVEFMGIQDRIRFDYETKCRIRNIYICKVDNINGEWVWVPVHTYKDVPPVGFAPQPSLPFGS